MIYTLYGIKRCDTVTKARRFLDAHQINYRFHDFREDGLDPQWVHTLIERVGHEALINRRGTTWRQLPAEQRDNLDRASAVQLILENPTLIKRPVLVGGNQLLIGFNEQAYLNLI